MSRTALGIAFVAAFGLAGCGSAQQFANEPKPAIPVYTTVYINSARVSLSPASVGAGSVIFVVTNQTNDAESLSIHSLGSSRQLATTGPINPQGSATVTVDLPNPGSYQASAARKGESGNGDSSSSIQPASFVITKARPSSTQQLLQP